MYPEALFLLVACDCLILLPAVKAWRAGGGKQRGQARPGLPPPQTGRHLLAWTPPAPETRRPRAAAARGRVPGLPAARSPLAPFPGPPPTPAPLPPGASLTGAAPGAAAVPLSHLEGLVCGGDEEELLVRRLRAAAARRGRLPAVTVRVVLAGQLPVGAGDLRLAGLSADAQHIVADAAPAVQALGEAPRRMGEQQKQRRTQPQGRQPAPARPSAAAHRHLAAAAVRRRGLRSAQARVGRDEREGRRQAPTAPAQSARMGAAEVRCR